MRSAAERIRTTHAGSLPRPQQLLDAVIAKESGEAVDSKQFDAEVGAAVEDVVEKQLEAGVDIVNDGEMGRPSYATYVRERLTGFGGTSSIQQVMGARIDLVDHPDFIEMFGQSLAAGLKIRFASCDGPISYPSLDGVEKDLQTLKAALGGQTQNAFMTAASPGVVAMMFPNEHYPDEESYIDAIATAMRNEYEAIHQAGVLLQLDCPDLALPVVGTPTEAYLANLNLRVEAINQAVANIPEDAMRMHVCWGNGEFPRVADVPLRDIIDTLLAAKPAGIMLMAANGRHEHEWAVFQDVKLPDNKYLIPGVVDTSTNIVEHPEVVAQRIVRYAEVVGPEKVVAGTDCGFDSIAGLGYLAPSVVWAKMRALAEGASLASEVLR